MAALANRSTAAYPSSVVDSIPDDLLTEILLRLPCPACLGKAAAVCTRFRRTILRPAFLFPAFLRRASFLAQFAFPEEGPYCGGHLPSGFHGPNLKRYFKLVDCRGGLLFFLSCRFGKDELVPVVCDPATGRFVILPSLPDCAGYFYEIALPDQRRPYFYAFWVIANVNTDGALFSQVLCAFDNNSGVTGGVCFHRAGDTGWDTIKFEPNELPTWTGDKVLPNNPVFLQYKNLRFAYEDAHVLLIDPSTREVFRISIWQFRNEYVHLPLVVLEDESTPCFVALKENWQPRTQHPSEIELHSWRLEDGKWAMWDAIPLDSIHGIAELFLPELLNDWLSIVDPLDSIDGFVFFERRFCSSAVIAIHLKTKQSFKLPKQKLHFYQVYPYWMVWLQNLQAQT